jgi:hypothetical protein
MALSDVFVQGEEIVGLIDCQHVAGDRYSYEYHGMAGRYHADWKSLNAFYEANPGIVHYQIDNRLRTLEKRVEGGYGYNSSMLKKADGVEMLNKAFGFIESNDLRGFSKPRWLKDLEVSRSRSERK